MNPLRTALKPTQSVWNIVTTYSPVRVDVHWRGLQRSLPTTKKTVPHLQQIVPPARKSLPYKVMYNGSQVKKKEWLYSRVSLAATLQNDCCMWCMQPLNNTTVAHQMIEHPIPRKNVVFALTCTRCQEHVLQHRYHAAHLADGLGRHALALGCIHALNDPRLAQYNNKQAIANTKQTLLELIYALWETPDAQSMGEMRKVLTKVSMPQWRQQALASLEEGIVEQAGCCVWCSRPMVLNRVSRHPQRMTIEHLIPRSQGGPNVQANFLLACAKCNGQRSSTGVVQWVRQCERRGDRVMRDVIIKHLYACEHHPAMKQYAVDGKIRGYIQALQTSKT